MVVKLTPVRKSVFFKNVAWLIDGEQFKNVKARLRMFLFCGDALVFCNK